MKRILVFVILFMILLSACGREPQDSSSAPSGETVITETNAPSESAPETFPSDPEDIAAFFQENDIEGLEFWILQDVTDVSMEGHVHDYELLGTAGGGWFGKDYQVTVTMDMDRNFPYVEYIRNHWPDISDEKMYITGIQITDPRVRIYGLSLDDSAEEWQSVLEEKGYTCQFIPKTEHRYRLVADSPGELYTIYLWAEPLRIMIGAPSTNREGIIYD